MTTLFPSSRCPCRGPQLPPSYPNPWSPGPWVRGWRVAGACPSPSRLSNLHRRIPRYSKEGTLDRKAEPTPDRVGGEPGSEYSWANRDETRQPHVGITPFHRRGDPWVKKAVLGRARIEGTRLHRSRGCSLCRDRHVSWNPFSKEPNDRPSASGGGKCFPPSMFSSSAFRRAIPNERIHPEQGVKSTLPRPVANLFDPSPRVGGRSRGLAPVDPRPSWMLEGLKVRGGSLPERGRIIGG